ncbi:hypothetical protein [Chryseobacterium culicis]|uniref:hypothetical protein n=1 Tax=Chryseobacterium culicis TaxID=680127 RepID=UPI00258F4D95|nr:hypothetical protein [Chryseobacterium culicis]
MKKIILLAAFGVAGLLSAKGAPAKSLSLKTVKSSKTVQLKSKKPPKSTFVTYTSCGVAATTTQDWSAEQGQVWADMVEAIYCGNGY